MVQLSISAACSYVRKAMDELVSVEDIGMIASPDGINLHRLVEGAIVEAVVRTHSNAPSIMIDGVQGQEGKDYTAKNDTNGVITITLNVDVLRIASVKSTDSSVVVCDLIPEDSAEGRKQLNKYVRGVPDDPRVVLSKVWNGDHKPILKYYSTTPLEEEDNAGEKVATEEAATEEAEDLVVLYYLPYPQIDETIVMICPRLEYAVLNEITAMVLDAVSEHEKAALFRAKSKEGK